VGGVAKHTYYLVKYLKKLGLQCKVLSFGDSSFSNDEVTYLQPTSSVISRTNRTFAQDIRIPLDIYRLTKTARESIENYDYDLIHVEEPYVGALVTHPRKVTTIHDTSYGEMKSIIHHSWNTPNLKRGVFYLSMGYWMELLSIMNSEIVITPYQHVKEELIKVYRVSKDLVKVVRNGIEIPKEISPEDKQLAKDKLGLDPGKSLIFTSAQHIARKRLDILVEAVKLLKERGISGFEVVLGGDGPLHGTLSNLVKRCNLQDNIHMTGWVSDELLDLYFQAADIFVLTSEYEAGPLSLLEAMANNVAVVSSRINGFAELITPGEDGLLYTVGDPLALSESLRELLYKEEVRERLSNSGRELSKGFDWLSVAEDTKKLYESLF
jgi:glycosyltransferase involved in cell wall biosynthesis